MPRVQDGHTFRCLLRPIAEGRVQHVDVIAVPRKIKEVGAFLRDTADGQVLAQLEMAQDETLGGFDFMDAAVVRRHEGSATDDQRPPKARRAQLVLPGRVAGPGLQGHDRVAVCR